MIVDQNEALRTVRELIRRARGADLSAADVRELCDTVDALDIWLATGNTLPEAWHRASRPPM